ncbi:MAG: phosphoribosyltransferase [Candidatus Heimdallarchaeota archaeon]|nr:MAG: phosphoribosyltransferase [Candidatus Heimdallarchaeota archaeon]
MIIEDKKLHNKFYIFDSRRRAGFLLGTFVGLENFDILFIIPNGGIPIGLGLLEHPLVSPQKPFDLLIVRKIHVPGSTEAGMGAVTPDGQIFLNEQLMSRLSMTNYQLDQQIERAKQQIEKQRRSFRLPASPKVFGKSVLITDDGIASGFSMLAGAKWLKKLGAEAVTIAVPTAPISSVKHLEPHVDKIICLNIRERYPFAVADAYTDWYDLSFAETEKYLKEIRMLQQRS